ncbi:uncharacterized protein EV420DRAFT_1480012 [Desarmillaria tabescens]|uniref:Uncharacterized protein n=1 Tax=Armillaria tabescens TaxID=1929756 RepID=A0AA39KGB6_ARMTA|nr:uncharacterized protein EV420DRAFT_1480012 [Desarmillaria tabescens]KAK0458278.1 hypothetical protein EV420DRAFT_1480012 [Desarmillaria tabescens]
MDPCRSFSLIFSGALKRVLLEPALFPTPTANGTSVPLFLGTAGALYACSALTQVPVQDSDSCRYLSIQGEFQCWGTFVPMSKFGCSASNEAATVESALLCSRIIEVLDVRIYRQRRSALGPGYSELPRNEMGGWSRGCAKLQNSEKTQWHTVNPVIFDRGYRSACRGIVVERTDRISLVKMVINWFRWKGAWRVEPPAYQWSHPMLDALAMIDD